MELKQVGFFDFVQGSDDPLGRLEEALERTIARHERGLSGSLLVLPEGFNLREPYNSPQRTPDATGNAWVSADEALTKLKELAVQHTMVFVAGLFDRQHNSAYWVDSHSRPALMCHKMGRDGIREYILGDGCDPGNPIERYGACVGALICLDALNCKEETEAARARRKNLVTEMKRRHQVHKIMCIPAHMSSDCEPQMDGLWCVLASSGMHRSVVKHPRGTEVLQVRFPGEICFADLSPD